jgi:hypothetical protein
MIGPLQFKSPKSGLGDIVSALDTPAFDLFDSFFFEQSRQ